MKCIRLIFILISIGFIGCIQDKDDESIPGLSLSELEGEWIIVNRQHGNINIDLSPCEVQEKLVFDGIGNCSHYIANTDNLPCIFTEIKLELTEISLFTKLITLKDSTDNINYGGENAKMFVYLSNNYGYTIELAHMLNNSNTINKDKFRKIQ